VPAHPFHLLVSFQRSIAVNAPEYRLPARAAFHLAGLGALVALAVVAGVQFNASQFNVVHSDTLYIPLLYESSILGFRTAADSNLFPDWLYYAAARRVTPEPIEALLLAGVLQCAITTLLLTRYCGLPAGVAYNAIYCLLGVDYYLSISGYHQGVILMALLYLRWSGKAARRAMSLVFTIADPFFALISCLFLASRAVFERRYDVTELFAILVGGFGAFFLCESSIDLVKFGIVLVPCVVGGLVLAMPRPGGFVEPILESVLDRIRSMFRSCRPSRENCLCSMLLLCAAVSALVAGLPTRYACPPFVLAIAFFAWRGPADSASRNNRWAAACLAGIVSFFALWAVALPVVAVASQAGLARYRCLADELQSRQVDAIATDFWTFKPLYFVQGRDPGIRIMPLDFRNGSPNTKINAHKFIRGQSHFIVKDNALCNWYGVQNRQWPAYCSPDWFAGLGVRSVTPDVCSGFEVVETERPVDFSPWAGTFGSKLSAFNYNFRDNIGKVTSKNLDRLKLGE